MFDRRPPAQYTANGRWRNGPRRGEIVCINVLFLDNPQLIAYILSVSRALTRRSRRLPLQHPAAAGARPPSTPRRKPATLRRVAAVAATRAAVTVPHRGGNQ